MSYKSFVRLSVKCGQTETNLCGRLNVFNTRTCLDTLHEKLPVFPKGVIFTAQRLTAQVLYLSNKSNQKHLNISNFKEEF